MYLADPVCGSVGENLLQIPNMEHENTSSCSNQIILPSIAAHASLNVLGPAVGL